MTVRSRLKRRMNQAPQEQNYEVADHNSWRGLDHETFLNPGALIGSVGTTSSSSSQVACSTSSYSETPATSDVPKVSPSESEGSEASDLVSDAAGRRIPTLPVVSALTALFYTCCLYTEHWVRIKTHRATLVMLWKHYVKSSQNIFRRLGPFSLRI